MSLLKDRLEEAERQTEGKKAARPPHEMTPEDVGALPEVEINLTWPPVAAFVGLILGALCAFLPGAGPLGRLITALHQGLGDRFVGLVAGNPFLGAGVCALIVGPIFAALGLLLAWSWAKRCPSCGSWSAQLARPSMPTQDLTLWDVFRCRRCGQFHRRASAEQAMASQKDPGGP